MVTPGQWSDRVHGPPKVGPWGGCSRHECPVKGGLASSPQQYDVARDERGIRRPGGGNDRCSAEPDHHVELRAQEPLTEVTADTRGQFVMVHTAPHLEVSMRSWLREPCRQKAVLKDPVGCSPAPRLSPSSATGVMAPWNKRGRRGMEVRLVFLDRFPGGAVSTEETPRYYESRHVRTLSTLCYSTVDTGIQNFHFRHNRR